MKRLITILLLLITIISTAQKIEQWQIEPVDTTDIERTNWLEFLINNGGTTFTNADETDQVYTASSWYTTTNNSTNWNTAYGWGDHAQAGYLTSYTETDPVFAASDAFDITASNINTWNNLVSQTITNGVTTSAPSEDAVFDALAAKVSTTGNETIAGTKTFSSSVVGVPATSGNQIPTLNQVMDSINSVGTGIAIGDFYQGGIVYWIDPSETYGYCAYPVDLPTAVWSPTEGVLLGASGTAIGTGESNTSIITTYHGSGDYGAYNCFNLTANGYSDWFLPSINGLSEIWSALQNTGLHNFTADTDFMSSTETFANNYNGVAFSTGVVGSYGKLPFERGVIPVRMFSIAPPTEAPLPTADAGDLLYSVSGGNNTWSGLAVGTNGQVLKSNGTNPVYSTDLQGVTSVSLTSSDFSVSGSPITTSGTITTNLLTGSVDAVNLNNNVISGQTALASGLSSTDELMISDAGSLKKMDVSVIETYMQDNLSFGSGSTDISITQAALGTTAIVNSSTGANGTILAGDDSRVGVVKANTTGGTQIINGAMVQNDSRLNTTTPAATDLLGFWDVSDGAQRNVTYKALLNALGAPVDLDGTTNTLDLSNYINGTITVSGNETITFTNMASGQTGNIEVNQTGTGSLSFSASGYTIKIHPSIYLSAGTTKSVPAGETPTYSYWVVGSVIKINGTQTYQ